LIFCQLCR
jgi:hypothetical protein